MTNPRTARIAKNTIAMYIRMLVVMAVSLYTSRVVLSILGVTDYGIYNVVGGIVTVIAFVRSAMSTAIQRFIAVEIANNNPEGVQKVFSAAIVIHLALACVIVILTETLGVWFLNTQMTIPPERLDAANWVLQCSLISFILIFTSVPYTALIIAHEKMLIYAAISIIEVVLKLALVLFLTLISFDKLKLYAILMASAAIIVRVIYIIYSKRTFREAVFKYVWNRKLYYQLAHMSGWSLFGSLASVGKVQGVNIILNIFWGPVINAAMGIANQVNTVLSNFVFNFQTALNPQLYKTYAANEKSYFFSLIFRGAKFSYFLMLTLSLPILVETEYILKLWLNTVPPYAPLFCRLILIITLIDCLSGPLTTAAIATGKIRNFQIITGILLLLILPIAYVLLKQGYQPEVALYVGIAIALISLFARLFLLKHIVQLPLNSFMSNVIVRVILATAIATVLSFALYYLFEEEILRFLIVVLSSIVITVSSAYFIGLNRQEKSAVMLFVKNGFRKIVRKKRKG